MALMTDSTTYETLIKKYDGFVVPACKIKVGSTQVTELSDIALNQLQLTLSLDSASSAHFSLHGNYDYESSSFPSNLKSTLKPGSLVEISLGYGSTVTMVFKGFLATVNVNFDIEDGILFEATALDARRLMKTDNRPYILHSKTNFSDIVKDIMTRYSSLCSLTCDATSDNLTEPVTQRESDYDFITQKIIGAGNLPHEFFIVADTAYFRKTKPDSACVTLGMNAGLRAFSGSLLYLNRKVQVQGFVQGQSEAIVGEATATSSYQSTAISAGLTVQVASDCNSASKAKEIATNQKTEWENESKTTSGSCIGLPEIVPGRYLEISKLDSLFNQKYYLSEVSHSFGPTGFSTSFTTKG